MTGGVKGRSGCADTSSNMIISDEQARLAAKALQTTSNTQANSPEHQSSIDRALIERISRALEYVPDTSAERIAVGREMLGRLPSSAEVAGKILSRMVSDSLR